MPASLVPLQPSRSARFAQSAVSIRPDPSAPVAPFPSVDQPVSARRRSVLRVLRSYLAAAAPAGLLPRSTGLISLVPSAPSASGTELLSAPPRSAQSLCASGQPGSRSVAGQAPSRVAPGSQTDSAAPARLTCGAPAQSANPPCAPAIRSTRFRPAAFSLSAASVVPPSAAPFLLLLVSTGLSSGLRSGTD